MEEKIKECCSECEKYFPKAKIERIEAAIILAKKSFYYCNAIINIKCPKCKKRVIVWQEFSDPPKEETVIIPI